jgi:DNA segregation ATPase FtsK/SpoIIIE, S-DNA-T family
MVGRAERTAVEVVRVMPRSKPKGRSRARRRTRRSLLPVGRPQLPVLEQHHRDLIGLGLVALAAFFACVFYLGWAGGEVGEAMADGLLFLFGGVGYLTPIVMFAAGALLVLEPMLPSVKPFRSGAICLISGLLLALGAGALGPDRPGDAFITEADELRRHGGLVGEGLYWIASTLFSDAGAHILFAFLLLGGVLLLTGGSVAGVLRATRESVAATTQRVRRSTSEFAALVSPAQGERPAERRDPPEVEPVVRATHVEMPVRDEAPEQEPVEEPDWEEPDEEHEDQDEDPIAEPLPGENEPEPEVDPNEVTPQGQRRTAVTEADDYEYKLPQPSFLKRANGTQKLDTRGIERTGRQLVEALSHFNVEAKVIGTVTGPHVTRYELRLAPGIKMSKVAQLKDDLAYALAAEHVRILAPIPGKQAVGVEVPNRVRKLVHLGDVFQEAPSKWSPLTVWLGKDIAGKAIGTDLAKQPHVLVAGTTGSGKSGCINAMLSSILLKATPNEVRMVLVDPKRVELNHYEQIPHLLTPVVTSPRLAANVLGNLLKEMEERYAVMSRVKTRSLTELNRVRLRQGERPLPYILCVIDELADLMMVAPAEVEDAIIRLAQKSRAVGIHLLLATQRPSADVITGMIKANVPARIAFAVSSQTDSRVILDQNGAESLLGQGDMLFRPAGESRSARIQGAYVTEEEIERLTSVWRHQGEPELHEELLEAVELPEEESGEGDFDPDQDELLADAIQTVVQMGSASTSMLQRRLRVGYTRAGRLIDMMERRGVISGYEGSKARQVLIDEADLPRVLEALEESPVVAPAQD